MENVLKKSHKNNKIISNNSNSLIFDGIVKLVLLIKHSLY